METPNQNIDERMMELLTTGKVKRKKAVAKDFGTKILILFGIVKGEDEGKKLIDEISSAYSKNESEHKELLTNINNTLNQKQQSNYANTRKQTVRQYIDECAKIKGSTVDNFYSKLKQYIDAPLYQKKEKWGKVKSYMEQNQRKENMNDFYTTTTFTLDNLQTKFEMNISNNMKVINKIKNTIMQSVTNYLENVKDHEDTPKSRVMKKIQEYLSTPQTCDYKTLIETTNNNKGWNAKGLFGLGIGGFSRTKQAFEEVRKLHEQENSSINQQTPENQNSATNDAIKQQIQEKLNELNEIRSLYKSQWIITKAPITQGETIIKYLEKKIVNPEEKIQISSAVTALINKINELHKSLQADEQPNITPRHTNI